MPEPFDQLVYCDTDTPLIGSTPGVQAAASSLTPEDLIHWNELLYPLVSVDHPYETLCYLVSGDRAALMYRIPEVANRLRPFIHVLIGRQDDLTPRLALGSLGWNWQGAIKKRPEGKELLQIDGDGLRSFYEAAEAGWQKVAQIGARPPEVDQLIVSIRDKGGPERGGLSFGDLDSLSSLGDNKFVIFTSPYSQLVDDQAPAKKPVQVLARLLFMLGINDDISKRIIGNGFSTHESKYRSGLTTLPRWVFATEIDTDSPGLDRFPIDLKGTESTSVETNKQEADLFRREFCAALKGYGQKPAEADSSVPEAPSAPPPRSPSPTPEEGHKLEGPLTGKLPLPGAMPTEVQHGPTASPPTLPGQPQGLDYDDYRTRGIQHPNSHPAPEAIPDPQMTHTAASFGPADQKKGAAASGIVAGTSQPHPPAPSQTPANDQPVYNPLHTHLRSDPDSSIGLRPGTSTPPVPPQDEPGQFADLSDNALVAQLSVIELWQFESMIHELQRRTAPQYREDRSVDMAQVRDWLIKTEFHVKGINEYPTEPWHFTKLYRSVCAFAISDQTPGDVSPEVFRKFLGVLASNNAYRFQTMEGGTISPLTAAMMETLSPLQGESRKVIIPYDLGLHVASVLGRERMNYLGISVAPPPPRLDPPVPPGTGVRRVLSTKTDVVIFLVVLAFVVITVCIGYYL